MRSPVPPPPRAPVFARSAAAPAAYGHDAYAHAYAQHQHGSYRSYGPYDPRQDPRMMAAPAPPNSLAPVAMQRNANNTGSLRAQETIIVRDAQPTMKWGVMIAVAGALVGGLLGIAMNAKHAPQVPVAAAEQMAPQAPVVAPVQAPAQAPAAAANVITTNTPVVVPAVTPGKVDPKADAKAKADKEKADKEKAEKEKAEHAKRAWHRWSYVPPKAPEKTEAAPPPPPKVEKQPVAKAPEKPAPAKETKPDPKPADRTGETGAAVRALSDAQKETSFSLGGSQ